MNILILLLSSKETYTDLFAPKKKKKKIGSSSHSDFQRETIETRKQL